ncbi:MAG: AAA family ATPase [Candidatus Kaiserbacteria bacterium]|nr:MAG: AAA family ATPase [Candidatus Kaiserbacteria bacterium]
MANLTLIGMAGAGKSHVGRRLAERLGYEFLDIDTYLENQYGKELEKIVEELGDERFIDVEGKAIIEATNGRDAHVFSPGGSSVYEPEAMDHLGKISRIVYLRVPFETIQKRIGDSPERMGRIIGIKGQSFRELYDKRAVLYEKYAHHVVDIGEDAEATLKKIFGFLDMEEAAHA